MTFYNLGDKSFETDLANLKVLLKSPPWLAKGSNIQDRKHIFKI